MRELSYYPSMGRVFFLWAAVSCQAPAPHSAEEDVRELEIRMTELINVEREARGLLPLVFSRALADTGREYSARMAEADRVHHDLDRPMEERIEEGLPGMCRFGENLSKHTSIEYSLGDLMVSPGHRANLLSPRFTLVGVGIARTEDGFLYITQEFARPCDPPGKRSKRPQNLAQ
ncbi:MAG: CAP domain-containing protein [Vicinamibacteria bacterium]